MYCPNCGSKVKKDNQYCPFCGQKLNEEDFKETIEPEIELDGEFSKEDIEKNKILSLFSYISFLFIIPLIAAPNSKYAKFHINQGICLLITDVIFESIAKLLDYANLGIGKDIAEGVVGLGIFILMINGIVNAVNGKAKRLPIIGKFDILK